MSTIPRRKFLQLSAVAAAGCFVQPGREAHAEELPYLLPVGFVFRRKLEIHDGTTQSLRALSSDAAALYSASRTCKASCSDLESPRSRAEVRHAASLTRLG